MDKTEPTKGPISTLRSDFEIYKTQVAIGAWCGVVVIFLMICALIYAFILIRKAKMDFAEKLRNFNPPFSINRPRLLSPNDPLSRLRREAEAAPSAYKGVERSRSQPTIPNAPSGFASQNLNSPGPGASRNDNNYRRVNENFLNKNRMLYNPSRAGDITPQTPSTPAFINTPVIKNGHFFS